MPAPPTLTRAEVEQVVRDAIRAPSVLNTQPWRFVARGGVVEVHLDRDRRLPRLDPDGRAATISCGAAVLHLALGVAVLGHRPEVQLLPDDATPTLLATVGAGREGEPTEAEVRQHAAIRERRSARVPYVDEPLPPDATGTLEAAAATDRAELRLLDDEEAAEVTRLVHLADERQRADQRLRVEVAQWTGRGAGAVDGLPATALGPAPYDPQDALVRDFAFGERVPGRRTAGYERHPTLAMLLTAHDDTEAWVRAGMALERVWLEATAAGLAMSLLTSPLELTHLRWLARRPVVRSSDEPDGAPGGADHASARLAPQAVLRLGRARTELPPTPRRPLAEVLEVL